MRKERGITLIGLIITILVLLILAVVTVISIERDDLIAYANNAASMYNQSVTNEQIMMNGYSNYLGQNETVSEQHGDTHTYNLETGLCTCGAVTPCGTQHTWDVMGGLEDYSPSTCTVCGVKCTHATTTTSHGTGCAYGNGWDTTSCNTCGKIVAESVRGCENDGTGKCKYCGTTNNI